MFSLFKRSSHTTQRPWRRTWSPIGLALDRKDTGDGNRVEVSLTDGYVTQMFDDGHLLETGDGYFLSWDALYETLRSPAYVQLPELLAIPPETQAQIALRSRNSLTDPDFSIS